MENFPLSFLPNSNGFNFVANLKNGETKICTIKKNSDGSYYVEGIKFSEIKSWTKIKK